MDNGRPAHNSYYKEFYSHGQKQHIKSFKYKSDVSGWQYQAGQINKETMFNDVGMYCDTDGSLYIGRYKNGTRTEGKKYEMQEDKTHKLFIVKHNEKGEEIEKKEISKGHKIV
jgi:hypothetical protein